MYSRNSSALSRLASLAHCNIFESAIDWSAVVGLCSCSSHLQRSISALRFLRDGLPGVEHRLANGDFCVFGSTTNSVSNTACCVELRRLHTSVHWAALMLL